MQSILIDTHVHTREVSPCGQVPAKNMVNLYKMAGYDGIVITDHYFDRYFQELPFSSWEDKVDCYLSGYRIAVEEGKRIGLKVYLGMEIRFQEGPEDYLIYGIDERYIRKNPKLYEHTLKSYRKSIKGSEILIFQAHPYRKGLNAAAPELLDGVEVMNGNPRHDSHNDLAFDFATNHGLMMISGSDAHQPEDVGRGGITISYNISSSIELARWMRKNRQFDLRIPKLI